ncbi:MAG: hypothetical protein J5943_07445 [Oribacterium sp.]|nr:hypothetical protein [Oribacterium sp.]
MKMKKGRKLISMLMLLTVMVSALATSVHASSLNRIGTSKVGTITQAYTGGNSQVYAHLITKADGTEVRYVYSKNYPNRAANSYGFEDSFAALRSVLTADYAELIPDSVDGNRDGNFGFFFCSDSSLEEQVNDNWTSAEYVARNFLTVQKEGTSYTYKCEGEGAGGAVNTSATAARQSESNRFELAKRLLEGAHKAEFDTIEEAKKAAWDAAETAKHDQDSSYTPQEYVGSEYVPLDFGTLTGADILNKKSLSGSQFELAMGCNINTSHIFERGKLVEVSNIEIIDHVATIYSEHATIISGPHNHDIKKLDAKEPTCTETGYKEHYECTECGKWFEDRNGHAEITDKSSYTLKATGHKWDRGEITKEATYDEPGIRTYTCLNDPSHTKEEAIYLERERDTDNSDGSSGGGSGKNSGSVSKQIIDINGNIISSNHQVETGVPASDVGGRWANSTNADTWTYTKSDETLARSEWLSLDYNGLRYWYYFNEAGNMVTNWFDYNGERFYLVPDRDGWRGRMATGWKNIDNKWYYFEIVPGTSRGKMYRSTVTPDGHVVGADGAWDGVGETPVGQV